MDNHSMVVVQCWDDGVTTDIRLGDILRRYGARATFNLCAGLHGRQRQFGWIHEGTDVVRLGWDETRNVYKGFTIANHSLDHSWLDQMDVAAARHQIREGRDRLQQFFGQPVKGFAYPFGAYNSTVKALVRQVGHVYARTAEDVSCVFPPKDEMAFHPCCHFLHPDFWLRYEQAKAFGVFYFWGHSYEMTSESMWHLFESTIEKINADPVSCWGDIPDLFD
jgi:peptidoglycan-N-acetylglucosamine deacetylase